MSSTEMREQQDQEELLDFRETPRQRARRKQLEFVASQARWESLVEKHKPMKTQKQTLEEVRVDKARRGEKLDPELLSLLEQQELMAKGNKEPWIEDVLTEDEEAPDRLEQVLREVRAHRAEAAYTAAANTLGEVLLTAALTVVIILALVGWMV